MPEVNQEKEIEELRESNHRLKLSIENTKQIHRNELEYLRDELQIKESELKSIQEKIKSQSKKKDIDSEDKLASLTEAYNLSRDENTELKTQVQQLQRTIEHLRTVHADRHTIHEDNEALKITTDRLNIELKSTQDLLQRQQSKVLELNQLSLKQNFSISEHREQLESRDGYISELQSRIKELEKDKQDAIMELQHTLMMQQNAEQDIDDPNRRGNSLFSEVEERRVRVEEELKRLRERVARLTAENYDLQGIIEKGDSRSAIILQQLQVINKSEHDVIQEFKKLKSETVPLFNQYRDRLEALKSEYKRKLILYRDGIESPCTGELESLRSERDLLIGQKMCLEQELWECRKDLKYTGQQWAEVEAKCKIFRTKLQALQEGIISGSEKQKTELDGNTSILHTNLNRTLGFDPSGGSDSSSKKWLYNSIINESRYVAPFEENGPSQNFGHKAKSNLSAVTPSSKKAYPETEEIAECKQQ